MSTDATLLPDLALLPNDVPLLKELVARLCGTIQDRDRRIAQLEQHLHLLVKRSLRPASEKLDPRQLLLFMEQMEAEWNGAAPETPVETQNPPSAEEKPPRKHTPHGRRPIPDVLEHQHVYHDLTPEQKTALGGEANLTCIGEDVTSQYEWIPSSIFVIDHHQKKYVRVTIDGEATNPDSAVNADVTGDSSVEPGTAAAPTVDDDDIATACASNDPDANANDDEQIPTALDAPVSTPSANDASTADSRQTTPAAAAAPLPLLQLSPDLVARFSSPVIVAPKPPAPIPGGSAGPGLLAQVIVSKYGDHLPLYRLEHIFARQGVHFARSTMCDWCAASARLLTPLTDLIRDEVLASFVIHTDDTPAKVRDAHAHKKFLGRFWIYHGDEPHGLNWFEFTNTRQRAGPDRVLADYTGYLQADGYGGYDDYEGVELGDDSPILKVACWAHARRKFHDALRTEQAAAQNALSQIGKLYKLEKELRARVASEWRELPVEMRAALIAAERKKHALPLIEDFRKWLDKQAASALPKSPIGVAVRYALNQWDGLRRYVEDGRLAIDNNAAERGLRGIAIGRKNWLFCGSEAGGRTAATLITLISSAVRNNLDPFVYLRDVLTRLPALGEKPSREQLLPLLPNQWKPAPAASTQNQAARS